MDYEGLIRAVASLILVGCIAAFGIKGAPQAFASIMLLLVILLGAAGVLAAVLWVLTKVIPKIFDSIQRESTPSRRLTITSAAHMHLEVKETIK